MNLHTKKNETRPNLPWYQSSHLSTKGSPTRVLYGPYDGRDRGLNLCPFPSDCRQDPIYDTGSNHLTSPGTGLIAPCGLPFDRGFRVGGRIFGSSNNTLPRRIGWCQWLVSDWTTVDFVPSLPYRFVVTVSTNREEWVGQRSYVLTSTPVTCRTFYLLETGSRNRCPGLWIMGFSIMRSGGFYSVRYGHFLVTMDTHSNLLYLWSLYLGLHRFFLSFPCRLFPCFWVLGVLSVLKKVISFYEIHENSEKLIVKCP